MEYESFRPEHRCWLKTGLQGDRSCPLLESVIVCVRCPHYLKAGLELLENPLPEDYIREWTERIASDQTGGRQEGAPVISFSLGDEAFALPAAVVESVAFWSKPQPLPGLRGHAFIGLVNIRGTLELAMGLHRLLRLADGDWKYFMVIRQPGRQGYRWVFPVTDITGFHRVPTSELRPLPSTLSESPASYARGVFVPQYEDKHTVMSKEAVVLLDGELLCRQFEREVSS